MALRIYSSETMIDHVGLVGRDIDAMTAAFRRLGFAVGAPSAWTQPGPDGEPMPLGQVSVHVMFPAAYVELTALLAPGHGHHLDRWLAKREGLHVMALRASDAEAAWRELTERGLVMPPIQVSSRDVTTGRTTAIADFKWFQIPESIVREGFACVVEHQTPELVFIPAMASHPNGTTGLRGLGAVVADLEEAVTRYRRLPGAEVKPFPYGRFIVLKNQRFVIMTRKGMGAVLPGATLPTEPGFAGLALTVKDIDATREYFAANGIAYQIAGEKSLWVKPELACGAVLMFIDEREAF